MVSLPLNFNGVLCRGQCKWSEKRKLPSQSSILLLVTHTHTTMSSISIRTSSTYVRFRPNALSLSLSILWSRYNKSIGGIRLTVVVIFFVSLVTGKPLLSFALYKSSTKWLPIHIIKAKRFVYALLTTHTFIQCWNPKLCVWVSLYIHEPFVTHHYFLLILPFITL